MALEAAYERLAGRPSAAARRLADRFSAERDRWLLWIPVLLGAGIGGYFWLSFEPPLWPGAVVLAVAAAATILLRARPLAFALAVAVVAVTVGFVAAKIATLAAAAPVLERRIGPVEVEA